MRGIAVAGVAVSCGMTLAAIAACGSPGTSVAIGAAGWAATSRAGGADQSAQDRLESGPVLRASAMLPSPGATPTADTETEPLRVGVLFAGGSHYCTASVVDSPGHNLLITAAHCIYPANGRGYISGVTFVPGYFDGRRPYGTWRPERLIVAPTWTTDSDPDLDVGFIVLKRQDGKNIQDVLGGNRLAVDTGFTHLVRVTGYPASSDRPVTCLNWSGQQNPTQLKFVCAEFFGGTSGSPWVTHFDPATATGKIVGVIGGFEEGGDTASVSYSAYLNDTIWQLYQEASG